MIDLQLTVTEAEYLEAQSIFVREGNRKQRWLRWSLFTILIASSIVVLFSSPRPLRFDTMPPAVYALPVAALVFLFLPAIQKYSFRKRFRIEKANLTNMHVILDERGYFADIPGRGSGIAEWPGMDSWFEGKTVIVLFSGLLMRLISTRNLSENQMDELRALLTEKIRPVGVKRKID